MSRVFPCVFWSVACAVVLAGPAAAKATPVSPLSTLKSGHVEIAMVGFTRESAEAFRTTTAAQAPVARPAPAPGSTAPNVAPAPHHAEATAGHHGHAAAASREHPAASVVVRRRPNRWPKILRNKWTGPLERIHVWWNAHFDRRHFPYPDNPTKAA